MMALFNNQASLCVTSWQLNACNSSQSSAGLKLMTSLKLKHPVLNFAF